MMSVDTESLTAAIGRRWRAISDRFGYIATSHPEFYGHAARREDSSRSGNARLNEPDASAESAASLQARLPIGPSCC
jgi:hypothetical protein